MKVLVVYAHPYPESFNHAVLDKFIQGLQSKGHEVEILDLYALGFNPVLSAADLAALQQGQVPADIAAHQERVTRAEGLAFIFPIWWSSMPALLKGWIDRVFSLGFAYAFREEGPVGLLKHRKAVLITTCGGDQVFFDQSGIQKAIQLTVDLGVLAFTGIAKVHHEFFYNVVQTDPATREKYLEQAFSLGVHF
ncbi:MAG: NAD(P)H-dependent oxidoreductase [Deltaproteobacteria bacterium]|nr:NAD(P)H-dependent oxidoreductase [Deltaproteobacteria bacterium]